MPVKSSEAGKPGSAVWRRCSSAASAAASSCGKKSSVSIRQPSAEKSRESAKIAGPLTP